MKQVVFEGVIDGIVMDRIIRDDSFSMPSMHFHPEYEIYFLLEGTRYYFIENKTYQVGKGSLVLINSSMIHRTSMYEKAPHDRVLVEIAEDPFPQFFESVAGTGLKTFFLEHSGVFELGETAQAIIKGLLFSMMDEYQKKLPKYQSIIMMKLTELLLNVSRFKADKRVFYNTGKSQSPKHLKIDEIAEYIQRNCGSVSSLDEISKKFYVSKGYLCRSFKDVTGFTVQDYINIHRIQNSQELLKEGSLSMAEIAATVGYRSLTNFERMFHRYTETSPLKYRKKMRLIQQKVRERKEEPPEGM
ncbi:MAG: AraC family transcriptional regulator [Clostridiales bacterium]|jgi:AraC-like DNA-binding protein|nr:AraC family transcriptional regulator [Clostridiales bacterium]